ncbi:hypothetical protein N0V90_002642 [Kalmusia sp. IMI 367209]|nr:hypothetical protein N0V90_002642 [Kalmusia sp. IMI 367209]
MAHTGEDEWEYEYDDNETEDFYIPIDLANVPPAQDPASTHAGSNTAQKGHAMLLKTKLRNLNAERREAESNSAVQNAEDASASIGQLQIIGLHTENPLIMYNDQLLSCEWTRNIGTELIFAKPESGDMQVVEPLRSLPSVDLLAMGSAKLVARAARMRPREDLFDDDTRVEEQRSAETRVTSGDNEPINITEGTSQAAHNTTLEVQSTTIQPVPSSFLGRLNAAKAKRGESSRLALSSTPDGSRLIATKEGATSSGTAEEDTVMGGT